ncbi:MAG: response regulator transcription factor [Sandaracinaceae bacterium]
MSGDLERGRSILIVDDDDVLRTRLGRAFEARGFDVRLAPTSEQARASARADSPELAVIDLRIGDASGLALVRELASIDPHTKMVMLTGYGSIATALEAVRLGAVHYLQKPADVDDLLAAFDRAERGDEAVEPPPSTPSLARAEWEHIQRVLADCGGNISQAARLLGLHRRSLQRKLAKYPSRV